MITMNVKANSVNKAYKDLCCSIIEDGIEKGDYQFFESRWGASLVSLCSDVLDMELDLDDLIDKAIENNKRIEESKEDIFSMVM